MTARHPSRFGVVTALARTGEVVMERLGRTMLPGRLSEEESPVTNATVIEADALRRTPDAPRLFEGADHGVAGLSFFLVDAAPGQGPALHCHPYAEVFVLQEGQATFWVADEVTEAGAGQIVIAPPEQPHRFANSGTGRLRLVALHPAGRTDTRWLEGTPPG